MNTIEKLTKAIELLQYFVNRVENGTIRSRTTYKMYKDFLDEIYKSELSDLQSDMEKEPALSGTIPFNPDTMKLTNQLTFEEILAKITNRDIEELTEGCQLDSRDVLKAMLTYTNQGQYMEKELDSLKIYTMNYRIVKGFSFLSGRIKRR